MTRNVFYVLPLQTVLCIRAPSVGRIPSSRSHEILRVACCYNIAAPWLQANPEGAGWTRRKLKDFGRNEREGGRRFDEVFFGWCSTGEYVGIMDISVSYVFIFVHLNFGYSNFEYPRRIYFIWLYFYINFYIHVVSANIIVKVRNGDMYKSANN